ncbi:MAG: RNase adapter RapZ [Alphaproteobacteria bacterium]|nr:RNase adapter RapZ [Alphaproteobacteria bacterium]
MRIIVVTGMSGAGRSTALKALEDIGYEAVDNLPLSLLDSMAAHAPDNPRHDALAIGIDIRTRDFDAAAFIETLNRLSASGDRRRVASVFLDCGDDELVRRFTETRRRHPLAADRPVADGLRLERHLLAPLLERADVVIDTSLTAPGTLKDEMSRRFGLDNAPGLALLVVSFSYRYGLPRDADLVFDARFLVNPHYDPELREKTGRDAAVGAAVASDPDFGAFLDGMVSMLAVLLPRYEKEGKSYLTIAVGCTGGRHRSVYVAEQLSERLASKGRHVHLTHRDIERDADRGLR